MMVPWQELVLSLLFVTVGTLSPRYQDVRPLSLVPEVRAILAAATSLMPTGRVIMQSRRICRPDLVDPECPKNLKVHSIQNRLTAQSWVTVKRVLDASEANGESRGPTKSATLMWVQRPLLVGDTVVMLVKLQRPIDEGKLRENMIYEVFLVGDSSQMRVVRSAQRDYVIDR